MNAYYLYMMTNRSRVVLYTGVTNDLERRVWEHQHGSVKGFTERYRLRLLVYHETYHDIRQAIDREKEIKGWRRSKKNTLVETLNPKWNDLSSTLDRQREIPRRPAAARDDNLGGAAPYP
ncbi:MAG: GIY-YIG nuclease family protein [Chthoniobacterales bacterium]